ncbi:MAG: DegT/DnrJ/EryC1/StrS family aminotransferase [Bacteroidota bacterium]|nr:DegT/DnrJ/EryC1/StrS family aminotransferase [Bacteroidota bacterium]
MSKLAINGGIPVREKPIASWPIFDNKEKEYLLKAFESGEWGKLSGKMNDEFERQYSKFQQAKHTITVCNGTVALRIALFASGIGPGDEVIVPSYTFIATATSVIEANAIPVFADIEYDSFNIDPESIEKQITPRTKAIIPVHFGGAPCNMTKIMEIANRYKLRVIEDGAQAQGSMWDGHCIGTFGDSGTFSFQSSKNMTSGEGGAIVTNIDSIAEAIYSFHNCGRRQGSPWYFHFNMGSNYRLSEFQAAILLAQLEREENNIALRRENASYLLQLLSDIEGIEPLVYSKEVMSSNYLFIAKYDSDKFCGLPKAKFISALNAEGIPAMEGYPFPLYKQPVFSEKNFLAKDCSPKERSLYLPEMNYKDLYHPNAEKACKNGFWFPNYLLHGSKKDIETVAEAINKIKCHLPEIK